MIRDRIVVGISDAKLSEKLQLDRELTLEKAITQVRQQELIRQQQSTLRGSGREGTVAAVGKGEPQETNQDTPLDNDPSFCIFCRLLIWLGSAVCRVLVTFHTTGNSL